MNRLLSVLPALAAGGVMIMSTGGFMMLSGPPIPVSMTLTLVAQTGCQGGCQSGQVPDNLPAGAVLATAAVSMSDGTQCTIASNCPLSLSGSTDAIFSVSGFNIVTTRVLSASDLGTQSTLVTALLLEDSLSVMLKLAFFAALFVCLWGPGYTQGVSSATSGPGATLKVTVVPSDMSACAATGQAGPDVLAAGFNTTALCNDFTTRIPNTVGTGLSESWLDCAQDGSTSFVWYWGLGLFAGSGTQPPCAGHVAWNLPDPVNGNLALQFTLSDSDISTYGFPVSGMTSANNSLSNPAPGPGQYPYGYYEWTYRSDNTTVNQNNAFWSWISGNAQALAGTPGWVIELDFTENGGSCPGCPATDSGINQWGPGGFHNGYYILTNKGLPLTSYHTWAALFTGDGGSHFSMCEYVDGVRYVCHQGTYDTINENLERRFLMAWLQGATPNPGIGTIRSYIKNIKVLTCANWLKSSASGMCPGKTLNSIGFYQ